MKSKVIDFTYANKEQKTFSEYLETKNGTKYPNETLNVPMWLILALHSELSEVLNASKLHKFWDKSEINREHLIEELSDFLSHMANLANFLEVDLVTEIPEIQVTAPEVVFNQLAYRITTLNWNKRHARNALLNQIVPLFVELVYSFSFTLEELEEAYKRKMQHNYTRFN